MWCRANTWLGVPHLLWLLLQCLDDSLVSPLLCVCTSGAVLPLLQHPQQHSLPQLSRSLSLTCTTSGATAAFGGKKRSPRPNEEPLVFGRTALKAESTSSASRAAAMSASVMRALEAVVANAGSSVECSVAHMSGEMKSLRDTARQCTYLHSTHGHLVPWPVAAWIALWTAPASCCCTYAPPVSCAATAHEPGSHARSAWLHRLLSVSCCLHYVVTCAMSLAVSVSTATWRSCVGTHRKDCVLFFFGSVRWLPWRRRAVVAVVEGRP